MVFPTGVNVHVRRRCRCSKFEHLFPVPPAYPRSTYLFLVIFDTLRLPLTLVISSKHTLFFCITTSQRLRHSNVLTIIFFGGIIYGIIFVTKSINAGVASTRESLKSKGYDVTPSGMSVKTSKHFGREEYIDATQRSLSILQRHGKSTASFFIRSKHFVVE
ncbi:hypothetical protein BJ912DRAFT_928112 [Pholiota molesta]|nr:hypothetical protein BJ912DRAFT_930976 [Pholiota molesta]KAF8183696.1 hypothetical protein BJ912DRAFT_928112 [Pholiota molesta]